MSLEKIVDFHKKFYVPENCVLLLYGNLEQKEILDFLDKNLFASLPDASEESEKNLNDFLCESFNSLGSVVKKSISSQFLRQEYFVKNALSKFSDGEIKEINQKIDVFFTPDENEEKKVESLFYSENEILPVDLLKNNCRVKKIQTKSVFCDRNLLIVELRNYEIYQIKNEIMTVLAEFLRDFKIYPEIEIIKGSRNIFYDKAEEAANDVISDFSAAALCKKAIALEVEKKERKSENVKKTSAVWEKIKNAGVSFVFAGSKKMLKKAEEELHVFTELSGFKPMQERIPVDKKAFLNFLEGKSAKKKSQYVAYIAEKSDESRNDLSFCALSLKNTDAAVLLCVNYLNNKLFEKCRTRQNYYAASCYCRDNALCIHENCRRNQQEKSRSHH